MLKSLRPLATLSVVYRSGGTHDCRWTRILTPFATVAETLACVEGIERAGRRALWGTTAHWDAIGLPVGWEPGLVDYANDEVIIGPLETRHIKRVSA